MVRKLEQNIAARCAEASFFFLNLEVRADGICAALVEERLDNCSYDASKQGTRLSLQPQGSRLQAPGSRLKAQHCRRSTVGAAR